MWRKMKVKVLDSIQLNNFSSLTHIYPLFVIIFHLLETLKRETDNYLIQTLVRLIPELIFSKTFFFFKLEKALFLMEIQFITEVTK